MRWYGYWEFIIVFLITVSRGYSYTKLVTDNILQNIGKKLYKS